MNAPTIEKKGLGRKEMPITHAKNEEEKVEAPKKLSFKVPSLRVIKNAINIDGQAT